VHDMHVDTKHKHNKEDHEESSINFSV